MKTNYITRFRQEVTAVPGDPYFNNVSLLLHGDGTNGSTSIVDSSATPKIITPVGNAQISTAQSKFGGSSMYFDGSSYATMPDSPNFAFGSENFNVECFVYSTNPTTGVNFGGSLYQNLLGQNQIGSAANATFGLIFIDGKPAGVLFQNQNSNTGVVVTPTALTANTWYHIAYVRNGSTCTLYINGVSVGSASVSGAVDDSSRVMPIGADSTGNCKFFGYLDEIRITKGVARYTANFTPPTQAFLNVMSVDATNFGETGSDLGDIFIPRALFSSGGLWSCGFNGYGELGDNTTTNRSSPVQTVSAGTNWKSVAAGMYHTAAIKTDGTLWTWGRNNVGKLGDNTLDNKSSPVQTISAGTNWKLVAAGMYHTAAIKTDGTLWTWGWNNYGQIGDNTTTSKSSPVQTVASGTNWKSVSAAMYHTAAIKTDGTLWTWGWNNYGGLGDNTTAHKSSPVQTVASGTNWKSVAAGGLHTTAIKTDGTLWLWGYNGYGDLGDNTRIDKSSPVQTIAGGTNWKLVAAGQYHTAAIKTDGTLWLWGRNTYGQLGDNTTANKSSPVQTIAAGTNWKSVAAGQFHTTAIKTDGTLWTWGQNTYGKLGDNTTTSKSSPVQTVAGGTNWKSVTAGYEHTAATKDDY